MDFPTIFSDVVCLWSIWNKFIPKKEINSEHKWQSDSMRWQITSLEVGVGSIPTGPGRAN